MNVIANVETDLNADPVKNICESMLIGMIICWSAVYKLFVFAIMYSCSYLGISKKFNMSSRLLMYCMCSVYITRTYILCTILCTTVSTYLM